MYATPLWLEGETAVHEVLREEASPGIWFMVGMPSMGKSTLSRAMRLRHRVSIDAIRDKHGWSSPSHEMWLQGAYALGYRRTMNAVRRGKGVVFDSTGLYTPARTWCVSYARQRQIPIDAVLLKTPIEVARQRDAARGRPSPNPMFENLARLYQQALREDLDLAGFRRIYALGIQEQEALLRAWQERAR